MRTKPPHEPTDHSRKLVEVHAAVGTTRAVLAGMLGIDAKTLRKHYRQELEFSAAKANAKVGGALYNKAIGGDTTAMIFWCKTRMGWRERGDFEPESERPQPIAVTIGVVDARKPDSE